MAPGYLHHQNTRQVINLYFLNPFFDKKYYPIFFSLHFFADGKNEVLQFQGHGAIKGMADERSLKCRFPHVMPEFDLLTVPNL
jgi:hypothetical protein